MVATAVPTIVPTIVSQDMAGIGVKARFADASFTNTSPRYLVYNNKWPSAESFAGGTLATRRISGRLFAQIEPSVQCVITENQDIDDNDWTKFQCTVDPNAIAAPDGLSTADEFVDDSTPNTQHNVSQTFTPDGSSQYCISIYAKYAGRHIAVAVTTAGFPNNTFIYANLLTGVIHSTSGSPDDYGIDDCGNGWYRIWMSVTSDAAAATVFLVYGCAVAGNFTYSGDGTSGFYLWMPQIKKGAVPSSPIHTEAVAVTRNADELYWASASVPGALRGDIKIDLIPEYDIAAGMSGGDRSIIEFDESGASSNIHVYLKASDGKIYVDDETGVSNLVTTGAVTASRGQKVTVQIKPSAGQVVLSNFTTGNGTTTDTAWSTSEGNVYFLQTEANTQQWGGLGSEPY